MKLNELVKVLPYKTVVSIENGRGKVFANNDLFCIVGTDYYKKELANCEIRMVEMDLDIPFDKSLRVSIYK